MIFQKLGPALSLGNTCVIKPPSINSLTAIKLAEIIEKLELPPALLMLSPAPAVPWVKHCSPSGVDMVAFTGSSETGKQIMSLASKTVKRLQLELGGKNPAIILEDADIGVAAAGMAKQQTSNSGQICGSPGRFYVHAKVYDEFLEKFTAEMKKMVMGDPLDPKTELGPLVSAQHRDRVEAYIKSAVDEGAKVILNGKRPTTPPMNKGYYVLPTIITGITRR